ncbi:hypothetical protein TVAG_282150 [Trichomonas vaginalis G3]|uniref:Uncharacterized protein n=1 Tax=Trichomonas vaginalis (strain ATCC PRA-98 / G3) TaxID=412133 RepID=A2E9T0_TRIV3|nr:hypothetical protein TVAGG3_0043530 [Trichomonas vaginalis G3]EAY10615.1 hypothetical protein TVAG_282150 [Trichomonas vaginalis G3]KAI5540867.1 hypothetical protein TVAGG3_0043530 [Trichomonas vaginalis G3]|eukprot:XP_001322838.1 hypothetical protein [Trichomonas vaginalis G3]
MASVHEFLRSGRKLSSDLQNVLDNLPDNMLFPKPEPLPDFSAIEKRANNYEVNIVEDYFVPIPQVDPSERFGNNIASFQEHHEIDEIDYSKITFDSDSDTEEKPKERNFVLKSDYIKSSTKFDLDLWNRYKSEYERSKKAPSISRTMSTKVEVTDQDRKRDEDLLDAIEREAHSLQSMTPKFRVIDEAFFTKH